MSDEIKSSSGRVVGHWDGNKVEDLMAELERAKKMLREEGSSDKLTPAGVPHRDQLHKDLQQFNAYPLWGGDVSGRCLVGANANRIENTQKVLSYSLIDHH